MQSVTGPDGATTSYGYTADTAADMGRTPTNLFVRSLIDSNGHAKNYVEDGLGRVVKVREFTGTCSSCGGGNNWNQYSVTDYAYDALNNLKQVVDGLGNITTINYDGLGRKTDMNDRDMGQWTYQYDNAGNLTRQQDAKGQVLTFGYDALNRMTTKSENGVWTGYYHYDEVGVAYSKGRRTYSQIVSNNAGTNTYTRSYYDARGRVSQTYHSVESIGAFNTYFTYDQADRVVTTTYPDGEAVTNTYDDAGQDVQLSSNREVGNGPAANQYVSNVTYNVLGQPSQVSFGNGSNEQYQYAGAEVLGGQWMSDGRVPFGRLVRKVMWSASGFPSLDTQYGYDGAGNVIARFYSNNWGASWEGTRYSYDHLDRLRTTAPWAGYGGESGDFQYNQIGNLISKTGVGNIAYPASGAGSVQPHAAASTDGGNSFTYDANGSMRTRVEGGVTYQQDWDPNNQLTNIVGNNGVNIAYAYDADGVRFKKTEQAVRDTFDAPGGAWEIIGTNYALPFNDGGQNVLRVVGTNAGWTPFFNRKADGAVSNGDVVMVDFKLGQVDTEAHFTLETPAGGGSRWSINNTGNAIAACWMQGGVWQVCAPLIAYPVTDRWYRMKLTLNVATGFVAEVWERDVPGGLSTRYQGPAWPAVDGGEWRFFHTLWRGAVHLDNYAEYRKTTGATAYIGQHYEWFQAEAIPAAPPLNNPTPTPTNTPIPPTSTNTPNAPTSTPTNTSVAPTATPTNTPTPTGCSAPGVLDTFNRANGGLGANWGGDTGNFAIASNQLAATATNADAILWSPTSFSADQEAFITLSTIESGALDLGLALKSQSAGTYGNGVIEVRYGPADGLTDVWTYAPSQAWVQHGTIAQTFAAGDVLKAKAKANGDVEVYKNGTLIGTVNVSSWPYAANGGYIGVWMYGTTASRSDDFGGGNSCTGGGGPTPTPTPTTPATPSPTPSPTPGGSGFVDDFNRANSTNLGSNWAERAGNLEIHSNALKNAGTAADNIAAYVGNTYANSETSARVRIGSGGGSVSIGARWDVNSSGAPTQGYNAEMSSSGEVQLLRVSDFAVLGTYQIPGYAANSWVTVALRATGSSLSVDVDGVTQITATDGTFSSGDVGVWSYQPGGVRWHSFDDFSVTQLSGSLGGGKVLAKPADKPLAACVAMPTAGTIRSYYFFNGQRIAMREQTPGNCSSHGVVTWLHGDPLGSATLATGGNGQPLPGSETRYSPFGTVRAGGGGLPNDRRFNGNRADLSGLLDFSARFMDPLLGRFVSADTIVPRATNPQALNRYAAMFNNPLRYTDPSGHCPVEKQPFGCNAQEWRDGLQAGVNGLMVEVNKLVEVIAVPPLREPQPIRPFDTNVTDWLISQMTFNATSQQANDVRRVMDGNVSGTLDGFKQWIALVQTDAIWDFKTILIEAGLKGDVQLGKRSINYQAVANIHFGFVGRAIGFSNIVLEGGAGAFQIRDNWERNRGGIGGPFTFFDDPFDNWSIRFGEYLYDLYGEGLSDLTPDSFTQALEDFIKMNGEPGKPTGG